MKDIKLKQLVDIINQETLTALEKAQEMNWKLDTVRTYTKQKKLKTLRVKSKNLYYKNGTK